MKFKKLVGRKFGDLKDVEKTAVLSSLIFDGSMWDMGRLENGRYEVTADVAGSDVAIPALLEVGTDENQFYINDNAVFYNCIQGVA